MQIFHYHPQTFELLGMSIADESPLEPGIFLIPSLATSVQPPEVTGHNIAVFNGAGWDVVADYRGAEYWIEDGTHIVITSIGETIPAGALLDDPGQEQSTAVPISITPRQGMLILSRAGLLETVQNALEQMEGQAGVEARIDFERAGEWRRDWPLLNSLGTVLGLTSQQIDALFIDAAQI